MINDTLYVNDSILHSTQSDNYYIYNNRIMIMKYIHTHIYFVINVCKLTCLLKYSNYVNVLACCLSLINIKFILLSILSREADNGGRK